MLILNDNELQHVDSTSEILEHYGVKGMKWGLRKLKKIGVAYGKWETAARKATLNNYRHPILSDRAQRAAYKQSLSGTFMGTTRSLNYQNKHVAAQLALKKKAKAQRKKAMDRALSKIGKADELYSKGKIDRATYRQAEKDYKKERKDIKKAYKAAKHRRNINIKY